MLQVAPQASNLVSAWDELVGAAEWLVDKFVLLWFTVLEPEAVLSRLTASQHPKVHRNG